MKNIKTFEEFDWNEVSLDSIISDLNRSINIASRIELVGKLKKSGERVYVYTTSTGNEIRVTPSTVEINDKKINNKEIHKILDKEYVKAHKKSKSTFEN